ncbi:FG-GAP-like repeat-containing protein [Streptomyces sp. NBC_00151]|uniref:FG-GAP-like repeat-containing protein n=1 Tax=Streptomyces sp. NBC_00151 TaxID=2975669 RepID=UPI002DD83061|nr:FG-GAP-like repeat-containing protein [Streptomyces sp. NBC_00151]WRZ41839.1 FG-GAP-like repeat-containing protein [Streptomyces sp. NBC_00151]
MSHRRSFFARRRPFVIGAGVALAAGVLAVPAVNAVTVPTTASTTPSAKRLHDDFNGDGYSDLAVGAPDATLGTLQKAGSVSVVYGASGGLSTARRQVLTWPRVDTEMPPQLYGGVLRSADLDGDGYADLVSSVGMGMMDVDDGYAIFVNWGGPKGLSATPTRLAWSPYYDWSGEFTVGDVDGDKHPDLVTNGADAWIEGEANEGGSTVRRGPFTRDGLNAGKDYFHVVPQKTLYNPVMAAGDVTGDGVDDLVVSAGDAGSRKTSLLVGGEDGFTDKGLLHDAQGRAVGGEDIAIGDLDKDGYGDIVVGRSAPGGAGDAGALTKGGGLSVVYGGPAGVSATRKPVWISQDTPGVPGTDEKGDGMGTGLSVGDTNGDGYLDVATGLPGEDVGTTVDAGGVLVLRGSASGLTGTGAKSFTQSTSGVPGTAERMDRFGAETALVDGNGDKKDGLVVGDPDENAGNGAVWTFSAGSGGITASGSASFGGSTLGLPATGSGFGRSLDD